MPIYQIHTIASAPEKSRPVLEQLQQAFGVIPNLAAVISNSPKLVTAFAAVFQQVYSSSFTEQERFRSFSRPAQSRTPARTRWHSTPQCITAQEPRVECMFPS